MEKDFKRRNHPPEVSFFTFGRLIPEKREVNEFIGSQQTASLSLRTFSTSVVEQDCMLRECLNEFKKYLKSLSDAEIVTIGTIQLGSGKLTRVIMEETGVSVERLKQIKKEVSDIFNI